MPSVKEATRLYNFPQQWVPQLSSIQRHFRYVLFQSSYFDICVEIPARQGRRKMVISIELARDFPDVAPLLRCKYERHTFIDGSTYIINKSIHPGLEVWHPTNDLGAILQDVYNNVFSVNPPTPMSPSWDSSYNNPLALPLDQIKDNAVLNRLIDSSDPVFSSPLQSISSSSASPKPPASVEESYAIPISEFTSALSKKSLKELKEIEDDPHSFLASWSRLDPMRARQITRDTKLEQAKSVEAEAKKLETELAEQEVRVAELFAKKQALEETLANLRTIQRQYEGMYSKQSVCDELLAAAQREELHSEEIAQNFARATPEPDTGKPQDIDTFLAKYIESRKLYRMRIDKRALLLSIPTEIRSQQFSSTTLSTASSSSSSSANWRPGQNTMQTSFSPFASNRPQ